MLVSLMTFCPCKVTEEVFRLIKDVAVPVRAPVNWEEFKLITAVGLETTPPNPATDPVAIARADDPLPAEGVAHVPSPRQKVVPEALVPLFKLVTGRFPATCEERLTDETDTASPVKITPLDAVRLL